MRAVATLAFLLAATAQAETLTGRVVGISDGDTITVLVERQQIKVRINGIDAPEKRQAFGERSKQNLSAMAFQKDARLECHKTDRYGRQVCKVWVQPGDCPSCGKTLDVGHAQVVAGMAWWYREYTKEQTAEDRGRYESAEIEARLRRWGLWNDPQPVPPWEWRRREWEKRQPTIGYSPSTKSGCLVPWTETMLPSKSAGAGSGCAAEPHRDDPSRVAWHSW